MTDICITIPEVPASPAIPGRYDSDPRIGWNAGARSIGQQFGDCYAEFGMPEVVGVVVGLTRERIGTLPNDVSHGFLFQSAGGVRLVSVVERGIERVAAQTHANDAVFRIERVRDVVAYKVDGTTVYTSSTSLNGGVVVVSCLYAAEDGVGVIA